MAHRHPIRQYRPRKRKSCKRYVGWSRCSKQVSYEGFGKESRLRAKGRVKLEIYFQVQSWQSSLWWGNGEGGPPNFHPKGPRLWAHEPQRKWNIWDRVCALHCFHCLLLSVPGSRTEKDTDCWTIHSLNKSIKKDVLNTFYVRQ